MRCDGTVVRCDGAMMWCDGVLVQCECAVVGAMIDDDYVMLQRWLIHSVHCLVLMTEYLAKVFIMSSLTYSADSYSLRSPPAQV